MDGPEHYRQAEISFEKARKAGAVVDGASAVLHLQAAQFHATMALVAATAGVGESAGRWMNAFAGELQTDEENTP